jgi:hypothetical protein
VLAGTDETALGLGEARLVLAAAGVAAKAGPISAIFWTRCRIAAKSAFASLPQGAFR